MVEFALIAPIFFGVLIGLFSAATYVFEVQVANDAAQAASRWGVAAINFGSGGPQCPPTPSTTIPSGMLKVARAAAGPFPVTIVKVSGVNPAAASLPAQTQGCTVVVQVPYASFGGLFGLGPTSIEATAVDYVT